MPSPAFTLSIPAAEPFRGLVAEAVRAYLRVSGDGTSSAALAFAASVTEAVGRLADRGPDIEAVVSAHLPQVEVQLSCGGTSETLTHTVVPGG